ncbi:MAG: SAM-dependent methyltransferase, partial [Mesorhizobium sp.]
MQPIVDTSLWLTHKRRALARPAAAVLFCQTPAAVDVLATSGKVTDIARVEADALFLDNAAGLVAPLETVPFEPESLDLAVSLLSLQAMNDIPGM